MGIALGVLGYGLLTWQFWLVFAIFLIAILNNFKSES